MLNLLWNMLLKWFHVTLLLQELMQRIQRARQLSGICHALFDLWSAGRRLRCGVKVKRNLL